MSDQDFREQVIGSLVRLETKMNYLVGEDGNGGRMKDLEDRTTALEQQWWKLLGFVCAISTIVSLAIAYWRHM